MYEFQFLHILTKACYFLLIKKSYYRHLSGYVVVSHCGSDLHFPNDNDAEHLFICFLAICILLWRNVYSNTLSIFLFSRVSKLSLFFHWSIVDLQYCISFWCTEKWYSYIYIHTHIFFFILHCPFFNWVVCLFVVELKEYFIYSRYQDSY